MEAAHQGTVNATGPSGSRARARRSLVSHSCRPITCTLGSCTAATSASQSTPLSASISACGAAGSSVRRRGVHITQLHRRVSCSSYGIHTKQAVTWKSIPIFSPLEMIVCRACSGRRQRVGVTGRQASCAWLQAFPSAPARACTRQRRGRKGGALTFLAAMEKKGGNLNSTSTSPTSSSFFGRGGVTLDVAACARQRSAPPRCRCWAAAGACGKCRWKRCRVLLACQRVTCMRARSRHQRAAAPWAADGGGARVQCCALLLPRLFL